MNNLSAFINEMLQNIAALVPRYLQNETDRKKGEGNIGVCVIDQEGKIYGRIFGDDRIRGREAFRVAWMKASQVWITGMKTGEFEKLAFNQEVDEARFGIKRPDYIGWEGGQPISLSD